MAKVTIFGHSDDLVEFRGDIHDELGAYGGGVFGFDDGTIMRADYGDQTGTWRFEVLATGAGSTLSRTHNPPDADEDDYTEKWELTGDFREVFSLSDWRAGDILPSAEALREALGAADSVVVENDRNGADLVVRTGKRKLVLSLSMWMKLLLKAAGATVPVQCDRLD